MNPAAKYKSDFAFLTALFFINIVGIMLVLSALSFAIKVPLTAIHFPLSIVSALSINYYASTKIYFVKDTAAFLKSTLLIIVLSAVAFLLAIFFYDVSIDGQTYHQAAIIALKNGWNPFYQELPGSADFYLWLNHYGKGAEIPQAVIYSFTNRIETGKATNVFLLIGSFFLTVSFLYRLSRFSQFKIYLISFLLTFNPVVIVQLFSYYIDLQLGLMLQCLLMLSAYLMIEKDNLKLYLSAVVIIILLNIKFTAIPYAGVFIIGLLAILWYRKDIRQFKKVFIVAVLASVVGIVLIGFNPYVTNAVNHGNPFYPLAGKGKIDIMTINSPEGFPKKNRFENFFTSYSSRTANMLYPQKDVPQLKIPFTFRLSEMKLSYVEDVRIAGFGVLFSGVLLLSIVLLILTVRELANQARYIFIITLTTLLVSIFIIEYSWWARYVPQLWFLPIIILVFSEFCTTKPVIVIRTITYVVLVLNLFLLIPVSVFKNLVASQKTKYQLEQLKTLGDTVEVDFGLFTPSRLKFTENHIPFKEHQVDSSEANFVMKYIHANLKLKKLPSEQPVSFLFKLDEKLKSNIDKPAKSLKQ